MDTAWRAVYLENEYLKCSVLPDIGGHLYTVSTNRGAAMSTPTDPSRRRQIGYRGAWAAFGIEFNFPVSHNWVVDVSGGFRLCRKTRTAARPCWWATSIRPYGMEWTVEFLAPADHVLEE